MAERRVAYFHEPGPENTDAVIDAVNAYLQHPGATVPVVVASISGNTAISVRKRLVNPSVSIFCVTAPACWHNHAGIRARVLPQQVRKELQKLGVTVVDRVPSGLSDTMEFSYARYGFRSPTWILVETLLAVGGYGLKTAVESVTMATDGGYISPFCEVVAVAGTDKGADTAIVARSTFSSTFFSSDEDKRFVVHEILAMPRNKVFHEKIDFGEWSIREIGQDRG